MSHQILLEVCFCLHVIQTLENVVCADLFFMMISVVLKDAERNLHLSYYHFPIKEI